MRGSILVAVLGLLLAWAWTAPAAAAGEGVADAIGSATAKAAITETERRINREFFAKRAQGKDRDKGAARKKETAFPPGLAKRGDLPPGLARQLRKGGTLPPGLAKRALPAELSARLPAPAKGVERVIVDRAGAT